LGERPKNKKIVILTYSLLTPIHTTQQKNPKPVIPTLATSYMKGKEKNKKN